METIIKLLTDNGIAIVCVGYLIYFQLTTMKDVLKTLVDMQKTQVEITVAISDMQKTQVEITGAISEIKDEITKITKSKSKEK